jgi:hypothetical protein
MLTLRSSRTPGSFLSQLRLGKRRQGPRPHLQDGRKDRTRPFAITYS